MIIPLIIEQMLAVLVGMADSIMVASVGEAAVSGVSLVDNIMVLLINVFSGAGHQEALSWRGSIWDREERKVPEKAADQLVWFITFCCSGDLMLIYVCRYWILHGVFGQMTPR